MAYPDAHRPKLAKGQQYIQWTEHHQLAAQGMPPCALHLWQHLLTKYPGGVPQEIELEEVRHEISVGRSKVYSVQSLKNAIAQHLVPKGLLFVVKKFTAKIMRVVANHAGEVKPLENKFAKPQFNFQERKQICEIDTSNPDSAVPSYRELHEHTDSEVVEEKDFPQGEELIEKYKDRLKIYGVYAETRNDAQELIPHPKMKPILQVLIKVPPDRAERSILAFLGWIKDAKKVEDKYKALRKAIIDRWEVSQ
ncbi:MAG: hypothetical protein ACRCZS_00805 [Chroococcidiopsis sp.]